MASKAKAPNTKRGAPRGNKNAVKEQGYHAHAIRLSFDGETLDRYFASQGYLPKEEEIDDLLKDVGYQLFGEHFRRAIDSHEAIIL